MVWIYHLIHSSGDGQLNYFHLLSIMNNAAMNTFVDTFSFLLCIFLELDGILKSHHASYFMLHELYLPVLSIVEKIWLLPLQIW